MNQAENEHAQATSATPTALRSFARSSPQRARQPFADAPNPPNGKPERMKDIFTKSERRKATAAWNRRADQWRKNPDGVFTLETAAVFGSDDPAVRAHADGMKKQLARLAPDVIVLNHRPAPDDTQERQARAIATALDACEKIAPNAEVYLVANIDPYEFAAAYRAALEYRRERDRRTP